jgi:hypothetical protein
MHELWKKMRLLALKGGVKIQGCMVKADQMLPGNVINLFFISPQRNPLYGKPFFQYAYRV